AGRARGGQVKPEQKRRRCVGSADQFAYGWQPPPRRERGSRSLGELVEAEDAAAFALISDAPSPAAAAGGGGYAEGGAAPHGRPAAEKSELDLKADAEARAAADSLREEAVEELDLEWDESRRAMLKILQEMCSPRHLSFSRPFLSPSEAAAASPPLLTLLHVRDRLLAGELGDIFAFACAVRHVFASCYLAHGSPLNGGAVARKQVRARASAVDADCIVLGLPPPAHSDGGGGDEDGCDAEGRRRSSRARIETQPPNTLALVRSSADCVAAGQFLASFGDHLGLPPFCLPELEVGLACLPRVSAYLLHACAALLRLARLPLSHSVDGEIEPRSSRDRAEIELISREGAGSRAASVEEVLAGALCYWDGQMALARRLDESDEAIPEQLEPREGQSGLAGALLHALCHAALLEQRSIVSEAARQEGASAAAQGGGRARFLGRDAAGAHYFHFSPLEERVYRLVPDPRGEASVLERAAVTEGEHIEVEVFSERQCGKEWRLPPKGRGKAAAQKGGAGGGAKAKAAPPPPKPPPPAGRRSARGEAAAAAAAEVVAAAEAAAAEAAAAEAAAETAAAAADASGDGVTLQAPPAASAAGPSFSLVDVPALLARIGKPPEGKAGRGRGKAAPGRDKRDDALYLALEPAAAAAQRSWSGAAQRLKKEEEGGADSGAVVQLGSAREVDTFERRMVAWLEGARDRAEAMDSEAAGESASADGAGVGAKIAEAAATRISGCGGDASRESELDAAL
ncbi:hypothetical protein EMIHUDRAFT_119883, partial [Emiliania huxleyi CCMP1516]